MEETRIKERFLRAIVRKGTSLKAECQRQGVNYERFRAWVYGTKSIKLSALILFLHSAEIDPDDVFRGDSE